MYYIVVNGQQAGPFEKENLKINGLTKDTLVWREGLNGWIKAADLPELDDLFAEESAFGAYSDAPIPPAPAAPGAPYGAPQQPYGQPQAPYGAPGAPQFAPGAQYGNQGPIAHTNWLPWAIIVCVLGFCTSCVAGILGIFGIVQANKANSAYNAGDKMSGDSANSNARTLTIIGLVLIGLSIIYMVAMWSTFVESLAVLEALG